MKVERDTPVLFTPVKLIIESQDELQIVTYALENRINEGNFSNKQKIAIINIINELDACL